MEGNFINSVPRAAFHNNTKETHVSDEMLRQSSRERERRNIHTQSEKQHIDDFHVRTNR